MAPAGAAAARIATAASAARERSFDTIGFMASPLEEMRAAVDHDGLAGDELAGIAGEIEDGAGEIFGFEIALQGLTLADPLHRLLELGAEEFLRPLGQDRGG